MKELIKTIARRILRNEIEQIRREAVIAGSLAVEREVRQERRLAGPAAVEAWEAAVEAGAARLHAEKRRSSRNRLRATA